MAEAEELESFARLNLASQRVFEMARDEEFGRMVVANRDIAVGDLVMEVIRIIHKQTHTT